MHNRIAVVWMTDKAEAHPKDTPYLLLIKRPEVGPGEVGKGLSRGIHQGLKGMVKSQIGSGICWGKEQTAVFKEDISRAKPYGFGRLMTVGTTASLLLGRVGIHERPGKAFESPLQASLLIQQGDKILSARDKDLDLVTLYPQDRTLITHVGTKLFPEPLGFSGVYFV